MVHFLFQSFESTDLPAQHIGLSLMHKSCAFNPLTPIRDFAPLTADLGSCALSTSRPNTMVGMRMECEDESKGANSEWSNDWIEAARGLAMKVFTSVMLYACDY
ncbi:hypothetical protein PC120_g22419 [Phytophthora cactorum]|nr:hypothetical protein PC120_g22419 [Phytophthora cactorum]